MSAYRQLAFLRICHCVANIGLRVVFVDVSVTLRTILMFFCVLCSEKNTSFSLDSSTLTQRYAMSALLSMHYFIPYSTEASVHVCEGGQWSLRQKSRSVVNKRVAGARRRRLAPKLCMCSLVRMGIVAAFHAFHDCVAWGKLTWVCVWRGVRVDTGHYCAFKTRTLPARVGEKLSCMRCSAGSHALA